MPEIVAGVAALSLVSFGWALLAQRHRRQAFRVHMAARWRILVEGRGDATAVYVFRDVDSHVMDRIVVARVPRDDPDWRGKVQLAKAEAAERIATLEADS